MSEGSPEFIWAQTCGGLQGLGPIKHWESQFLIEVIFKWLSNITLEIQAWVFRNNVSVYGKIFFFLMFIFWSCWSTDTSSGNYLISCSFSVQNKDGRALYFREILPNPIWLYICVCVYVCSSFVPFMSIIGVCSSRWRQIIEQRLCIRHNLCGVEIKVDHELWCSNRLRLRRVFLHCSIGYGDTCHSVVEDWFFNREKQGSQMILKALHHLLRTRQLPHVNRDKIVPWVNNILIDDGL